MGRINTSPFCWSTFSYWYRENASGVSRFFPDAEIFYIKRWFIKILMDQNKTKIRNKTGHTHFTIWLLSLFIIAVESCSANTAPRFSVGGLYRSVAAKVMNRKSSITISTKKWKNILSKHALTICTCFCVVACGSAAAASFDVTWGWGINHGAVCL